MRATAVTAYKPRTARRGARARLSEPDPEVLAVRATQTVFLEAYARTGVVLVGTRSAGIARDLLDVWLRDPGFRLRYAQAEAEAVDHIRSEMHRRGIAGVTRHIFKDGTPAGEITEYSDRLLLELHRDMAGRGGPPAVNAPRGAIALLRRLADGPDISG